MKCVPSCKAMPYKIVSKKIFNLENGEPLEAWKNIASEYSSVYKSLPNVRTNLIFPSENEEFIYNPASPLDLTTNYNHSYVKHPQPTKRKVRIPSLPLFGSGDASAEPESTYTEEYAEKSAKLRTLCLPNPAENKVLEQGSDFDKKTSEHRYNYRSFSLPEFKEARRLSCLTHQTKVFAPAPPVKKVPSFSTTSRSDYKDPKTYGKLFPIIRPQEMQPSQSAMELCTTQKSDYQPKEVEKIENNAPSVLRSERKKESCVFPINKEKLSFISTSKGDFQPHETNICRQKSFKPRSEFIPPETPFTHCSVYSEDFVKLPKDIGKVTRCKDRTNLKLEDFEPDDTPRQSLYQETFVSNYDDYRKCSIVIPTLTQVFPPPTSFCSETSYGETYKTFLPQDVIKVMNFNRESALQPSKDKFASLTTMNEHFRGAFAPPRSLIKPIIKEGIDFAYPVDPL